MPVGADKKACPLCGEEILAVAIKCKHCKSDLPAVAAAAGPPPVAVPAAAPEPITVPAVAAEAARPSSPLADTRAAFVQARFNERYFGVVATEVFVIAAGLGVWRGSWVVFGVAFLGLLFALQARTFAVGFTVLMSALWGLLAGRIGMAVDGAGAAATFGVIGFAVAAGLHMAAIDYLHDLARPEVKR